MGARIAGAIIIIIIKPWGINNNNNNNNKTVGTRIVGLKIVGDETVRARIIIKP